MEIDRNKAQDMGVNVEDIVQTLQTYFSEQRMGYFIRDNNQYYVLTLAERESSDEPQDLSRLSVINEEGEMVALQNLLRLSDDSRPPELLRYNRYMSATMAEGRMLKVSPLRKRLPLSCWTTPSAPASAEVPKTMPRALAATCC